MGLGVKGVLEWVKVSHWLRDGLVVSLYGLEQASPHELAFGIELASVVISSRNFSSWKQENRFYIIYRFT